MKKILKAVYIVFCVAICLCGCSLNQQKVINYNYNGCEYVVDTVNKTISDGKYTYEYLYTSSQDYDELTITYPDGSSWWMETSYSEDGMGALSSSGWSDDYDESRYTSGDTLHQVFKDTVPNESNRNIVFKVIFSLLGVGLGIFMTVSPYTIWYWSHGWKYKDAEPTDAFLGWTRALGIIVIILTIGVFLFM